MGKKKFLIKIGFYGGYDFWRNSDFFVLTQRKVILLGKFIRLNDRLGN